MTINDLPAPSTLGQGESTIGDLPAPDQASGPDIAYWESLVQGFGQGASLGLADEMLGFINAGWDKMSTQNKKDFWDLYQDKQEWWQDRAKAAAAANPVTNIVGEIAGGVFTLGKITSPAKMIAAGLAEGLGRTEADLIGEEADYAKAAKDVALYGALTAGGLGVIKGLRIGGAKLAKILPKDESLKLGEAVGKRMHADREAIDNISSALNNKKLRETAANFTGKEADDFATFSKTIDTEDVGKLVYNMEDHVASPGQISRLTKDPEQLRNLYNIQRAGQVREGAGKAQTLLDVKSLYKAEMNAKKITGDLDKYISFRVFTQEANKTARFAKVVKIPNKLSNSLSKKYYKTVTVRNSQAFKQGLVNEDMYKTMRKAEFAAEELSNMSAIKYSSKFGTSIKDPMIAMSGKISRYLSPPRYNASSIDGVLGTRITIAVDNVHFANNNMTSFSAMFLPKLNKIESSFTKLKIDKNMAKEWLDTGDSKILSQFNSKQREAIAEWRNTAEAIRKYSNNEYGTVINKIENYAPRKMKEPEAITKELKNWSDEDSIVAALDNPGELKELLSASEELTAFKEAIEQVYGQKIIDRGELVHAIGNLGNIRKTKTSIGYEVNAAYMRNKDYVIPDRLIEKDPIKLLYGYLNNTAKGATMPTALKALDAEVKMIRSIGMRESAEYFDQYLKNMSGIPMGLDKSTKQLSISYSKSLDKLFGEEATGLAKYAKNTAVTIPDIMREVTNSIYTNMIGLNPKALLRQYSQCFFMTGTEIGGVYGQKTAMYGVGQALATQTKAGKGFISEARNILTRKGLAPAAYTGDMEEHLARSMYSSVPLGVRKVNTWSKKAAMFMYQHADYQNRLISMHMGERVVADLFGGAGTVKVGGALTKNQTAAKKFVEMMEPGYRGKMKEMIKYGASQAEMETLVSKYLIAKTQLVYGKAGMHEFGRSMGPLFSMFTTWPANVASDIVMRVKTDGLAGMYKSATKYLVPMIALSGIDAVSDAEDSPRGKALMGAGGASYYAPGWSATDLSTFSSPPVIKASAKVVKELADLAKDPDKLARTKGTLERHAIDLWQTYSPGMVWYHGYKRFNALFFNKEK